MCGKRLIIGYLVWYRVILKGVVIMGIVLFKNMGSLDEKYNASNKDISNDNEKIEVGCSKRLICACCHKEVDHLVDDLYCVNCLY